MLAGQLPSNHLAAICMGSGAHQLATLPRARPQWPMAWVSLFGAFACFVLGAMSRGDLLGLGPELCLLPFALWLLARALACFAKLLRHAVFWVRTSPFWEPEWTSDDEAAYWRFEDQLAESHHRARIEAMPDEERREYYMWQQAANNFNVDSD